MQFSIISQSLHQFFFLVAMHISEFSTLVVFVKTMAALADLPTARDSFQSLRGPKNTLSLRTPIFTEPASQKPIANVKSHVFKNLSREFPLTVPTTADRQII